MIVDLKRQNAILESQSKTERKTELIVHFIKMTFFLCLVRLLERMKETSLYSRNHESDGIQTTRNLLTYSTI